MHHRLVQVQKLRDTLGVSLEDEVRAMSKPERQQMLKEIALPVEIPVDHTLAIKSNLAISWNKLCTLRRSVQDHLHQNDNHIHDNIHTIL